MAPAKLEAVGHDKSSRTVCARRFRAHTRSHTPPGMSHSPTPPLPDLTTLRTGPSWRNNGGKTDRSACAELRASEVWPLVESAAWRTIRAKFHEKNTADHTGKRRACQSHREASAEYVVGVDHLLALHRRRAARRLSGDYRTAKANAMKVAQPYTPPPHHDTERRRCNAPAHRPVPRRDPRHGGAQPGGAPDQGLTTNPNTFIELHAFNPTRPGDHPVSQRPHRKMLGLPTDWSQPLRVERWRLHSQLARHYLVCPACDRTVTKLFMPLCTQAELTDALIADTWLKTWGDQIASRPDRKEAAQYRVALLDRYGPLLPPRRLLCRNCLDLRYGEGNRKRQPRKRYRRAERQKVNRADRDGPPISVRATSDDESNDAPGINDPPMVMLTARIPKQLKEHVEQACKRDGLPVSALVRRLLEQHVASEYAPQDTRPNDPVMGVIEKWVGQLRDHANVSPRRGTSPTAR